MTQAILEATKAVLRGGGMPLPDLCELVAAQLQLEPESVREVIDAALRAGRERDEREVQRQKAEAEASREADRAACKRYEGLTAQAEQRLTTAKRRRRAKSIEQRERELALVRDARDALRELTAPRDALPSEAEAE